MSIAPEVLFVSYRSSLVLSALLLSTSPAVAQVEDAPSDAPEERPRLLVMQFQAEGADKRTATSAEDLAANAFASTGRFEVMAGSDLEELVQLESEKMAMGCDDSECLAEIAGALGAEYVVTGRLSRLGSLFVLKLSLLQPAQARTAATETFEVESVEDLAAELRRAGPRMTHVAFGEEVPKDLARDAPERVAARSDDGGEGAGPEEEGGVLGSVVMWSGLGVVGLGGLAFFGGLAAVAGAIATTQTPSTPGTAKLVMRPMGDVGIALVLGSVVLGVVGLVATGTGFILE